MRFADVVVGCLFEQDAILWVKSSETEAASPDIDAEDTVFKPEEEVQAPCHDPSIGCCDFFVLFKRGAKLVGPFSTRETADKYAEQWGAGHAQVVQPSIGK